MNAFPQFMTTIDGRGGIHTNLPAAITGDVGAALAGGSVPADSSERERAAIEDFKKYLQTGDWRT